MDKGLAKPALGWEDLLEKEMAAHSSILAWRIPGTEEPGGLPSMGSQRVGQWRNNSRKNEEMEPKQKQNLFVGVIGDRSKVRCCKEQYCIGTWNVRPMN